MFRKLEKHNVVFTASVVCSIGLVTLTIISAVVKSVTLKECVKTYYYCCGLIEHINDRITSI